MHDTPIPVKKGIVVILHPNNQIQLTGDDLLHGVQLSFDVFARGSQHSVTKLNNDFPYGQPVLVRPFSPCVHLLEQHVHLGKGDVDELQQFKQQIILQQILALLLEHAQSLHYSPTPDEAVRATIEFIEQHYTNTLTVEQLAALANVGRSKYSSRFQEMTGFRPLDYISRVRIEQAKKLLIRTDDPLREIARSVGFSDEYYFNRRFSKITGSSPKQYAHQHRNGSNPIAVPLHAESDSLFTSASAGSKTRAANRVPPKIVAMGSMVGHMLALGIRPVGAELTVIRQQVVYRNLLKHIEDVGVSNNASIIAKLEPDLIVYEQRSDAIRKQLEQVAPTLTINPASNTYEQLRSIASYVGQEQKAEQWIASYEKKHAQMWKRLHGSRGTGQTAGVLLDLDDQWYVMGVQGFPLTLYHPLGFEPSPEVASLMKKEVRFLNIQKHEVANYAGDCLFVLTSCNRRDDAYLRQRLAQTSWIHLPPNVRNRTYTTYAKWNFDDPITRDRLLKVMPRILEHPLS